jgi:polar amino acid transport system substrate-binding protein
MICRTRGLVLFCSAWLACSLATAQCSRAIKVPLAPIGLSVTTNEGNIGGVYPELLRSLGASCSFDYQVVPRARMEALFESGQVDLLIPASRSPRRDEFGVFVPLIQARATLISLNSERPPLRSVQDLLAQRDLRVALVRGFDYGSVYQSMIQELRQQGRLALEVDALSVARMLDAGMADVTVMAPSILTGTLVTESRVRHLLGRLRIEPVEDFPWTDSGVYLSKRALNEADRAALTALFERAGRSGVTWRSFQQHYPASSLDGSIRPRRSGTAGDPAPP